MSCGNAAHGTLWRPQGLTWNDFDQANMRLQGRAKLPILDTGPLAFLIVQLEQLRVRLNTGRLEHLDHTAIRVPLLLLMS